MCAAYLESGPKSLKSVHVMARTLGGTVHKDTEKGEGIRLGAGTTHIAFYRGVMCLEAMQVDGIPKEPIGL